MYHFLARKSIKSLLLTKQVTCQIIVFKALLASNFAALGMAYSHVPPFLYRGRNTLRYLRPTDRRKSAPLTCRLNALRMKMMRRRVRGLRELRLTVADACSRAVLRRVAKQVPVSTLIANAKHCNGSKPSPNLMQVRRGGW